MAQNMSTKIYLAKNIKLDKNYRAVLNYSESQMLELISDPNNLVYYNDKYSFIRQTGTIQVNAKFNVCLQANYMAFQNSDYSGKWFFAFIDEVRYVNDNATEIAYTVDEFSTWRSYFDLKACYVIREHVVDDTLGANLVPEGLETGEYIVNSHLTDSFNNQLCIVTGSTVGPSDLENYMVQKYNGIPVPLVYCRWESLSDLQSFIRNLNTAGKIDAMQQMFFAPQWLCTKASGTVYIENSNSPVIQDLGISRISSLDTYVPVNNKLLCYPYCYIGLSNAIGQYNILHQEFWQLDNNDEMIIRMSGVLCAGCSIRVVPLNYKGDGAYFDESISVGKFPQLAWSNDLYTNWETQNGINILGIPLSATSSGLLGSVLQTGTGAITGNFETVGAGVGNLLGTMKAQYQHSLLPNQVEGSLNSGDVTTMIGANRLHMYRVTITREFAQRIDKFFTRMGYQVNNVKVPNITHRQNYNFVQIASDENTAYSNNYNNVSVPANALNNINNLFRRGITIWNNHVNLGDYSVSNNITS